MACALVVRGQLSPTTTARAVATSTTSGQIRDERTGAYARLLRHQSPAPPRNTTATIAPTTPITTPVELLSPLLLLPGVVVGVAAAVCVATGELDAVAFAIVG